MKLWLTGGELYIREHIQVVQHSYSERNQTNAADMQGLLTYVKTMFAGD